MPSTVLAARQFPTANIPSYAFASLPTLASDARAVIWCPDHPVWGATDLWWDGSIWTVNDFAISSFSAQSIPASGTGRTIIGTGVSTTGTIATPAVTTTNRLTQERRSTYTSAATAGALAYERPNQMLVWRGNTARTGGFSYSHRFGIETLVSGNRFYVGLTDSNANPTNVDPLAATTPGKVGVGINANTGNLFLINNTTGTAPTTLDLGSNFSVNNTTLYELNIWCDPNDTGLDYQLINRNTNNIASGTLTTNIPANTTFLAPVIWITNNATASACAFANATWQVRSRT